MALTAALTAPTALAAEIVHVGRDYVIIRAGEEEGLADGDEVCVGDKDGEPLGCGTVKVLRRHLAGVRLDAQIAEQLTEGMTATPKSARDQATTATAKAAKPAAPAKSGKRRAAPRLTLDYLASVRSPFRYRLPTYDLSAEIAGSGPLWRGDETVTASKIGLEMSFAWPLGPRWLLAPGLHYRAPQEDALMVDYRRDDPSIYLESTTRSSSSGLSIDARFAVPMGPFELLTSGGVDVDRSEIRFVAKQKGDGSETSVVSFASRLLAVSLHLGLRLEWVLGPVGIGLGAAGLLPVAGTAAGTPGGQTLKPEVAAGQATAAGNDLKNALGHERAKSAAELTLGISARL